MQSAGIAGSVDLQFIVDTTGHVEPNSLKVLAKTHDAFVEPAKEAVLKGVYRRRKYKGEPVRQQVQQRISVQADRILSSSADAAAPTRRGSHSTAEPRINTMGVDLLHLWAQMGWFAKGIVVIMALMSIFSLTIMITKFIQIKKSETATRKFAPTFSRAIQEENLDQAIALSEKNRAGHLSRVVGGRPG